MSNDGEVRESLLEAALEAGSPEHFERALSAHGPVRAEEIPALAAAAGSWNDTKRRNAARLLTISTASTDRDAALRELVRETEDVGVWAIAMAGLLGAPDAATVAQSRMDLVERALESQDHQVLGTGLRAGVLAGHPRARERVRESLRHPDSKVRAAALQALAASGSSAGLEGELRRLLVSDADPGTLRPLLEALVASEDTTVQQEVIRAYLAADKDAQNTFSQVFRESGRPWVRRYFLPLARDPGPQRARAVHILGAQPDAELVRICVDLYENAPPKGDPEYVAALMERGPCDNLVSALAGRRVVGEEALTFARQWLAEHS